MNKDHELYKMWITMTDMSDETQAINAFVKVSVSVLGPGDKPPVHDPSKDLNNKNDNGVTRLFTPGRAKLTGHIIKFGLYRAEHLAPLDLEANSVDPYIKISFAGTKAETKTFKSDRNPSINQELSLACKMPCMNTKIKCEIWDDNILCD
jgi:dysferlin